MKYKEIPMIELTKIYKKYRSALLSSIDEVLKSGKYILGPKVSEFEDTISKWLGVKYALGVNSGTDALKLALKSIDLKERDEVITTPFTFIATAETIIEIGAKPIFVDIDLETFNINPKNITNKISSKTKAILIVHLFGLPCNMSEITSICKENSLLLIEDVAQAFGSMYKNNYTGQFGNISCFSFYPTKNLFTYGDGGLIITNNYHTYEKCKLLRNHGIKQNYEGDFFGYNSRLDAIHAAILLTFLPYLNELNDLRRKIAHFYNDNLKNTPDIIIPKEIDNAKHVYNLYTIRVLNNKRDYLRTFLLSKQINTTIYYPKPLHLTKPFYFLNHKVGDFPNAEQAAKEVLSLPLYPYMPLHFVKKICKTINEAMK